MKSDFITLSAVSWDNCRILRAVLQAWFSLLYLLHKSFECLLEGKSILHLWMWWRLLSTVIYSAFKASYSKFVFSLSIEPLTVTSEASGSISSAGFILESLWKMSLHRVTDMPLVRNITFSPWQQWDKI